MEVAAALAPLSRFLFDLPEAWSSVGTLPVPTSSGGHGRAGAVKDAEGTPEERVPSATVLDGPEHRGTRIVHRRRQAATGRLSEESRVSYQRSTWFNLCASRHPPF